MIWKKLNKNEKNNIDTDMNKEAQIDNNKTNNDKPDLKNEIKKETNN